jgi:cytochrome bd ubiquinol oxidase subunit I
VLGISAYNLLRSKLDPEPFKKSFQIGIIFAVLGTVGVAGIGHLQGQYLIKHQPMKMAAAEALWNTEDPAALSLFTIGDEKNMKDVISVKVPRLLSLIALDRLQGEVKGINNLQAEYEKKYGPGDYSPPVWITYWSFRAMVGAGVVMLLLALYGAFLLWRKRLERRRWFLKVMVAAIALPYIANASGWLLTELGRQPWVVYGVMKTESAVSPSVSAPMVLTSLIVFTLLYGALAGVDGFLLAKYARQLPSDHHDLHGDALEAGTDSQETAMVGAY